MENITTNTNDDSELVILENIYSSQRRSEDLTQRNLADAAGLSLGMTNTLIKRFAEKGWIMLRRLNSRTIQYALTAEGINEIAHRTYKYFKRTAQTASFYRDIIEEYIIKSKTNGFNRIVLAGVSDLDFLIEYACERHGLLFIKTSDPEKGRKFGSDPLTLVLLPERQNFDVKPMETGKNEVDLSYIILKGN